MATIDSAQAHVFVPDKRALYDALLRNQFILPPFKDQLLTTQFLMGIKDRTYWCLHSDSGLAMKSCADPPTKLELSEILSDVMLNYRPMGEPTDSGLKRTALQVRKRPPQRNW